MTPREMLEEVKTRFTPLFITDEKRLDNLLRQALRTYQDRAGVLRNLDVCEQEFCRPADALELVTSCDSRGTFVECREIRLLDGTVRWRLLPDCRHTGPYRLTYLLHLAEIDLDSGQLPRGTTSLLADYLEALIDIENTRRNRMALQTGGLPYDHLRADMELQEVKLRLEENMQETAESLPIIVTV